MNNELWQKALERLRPAFGDEAVELWLKPSQPGALADGKLALTVPNRFYSSKIQEQFLAGLENALSELAGQPVTIDFVIAPPPDAPARRVPEPAAEELAPEFPLSDLNPKYTFESFVKGPSNRFAHATAEAIAKNPGRQYNPLFLYGGVGLGKTHLLHAIGHAMRKDSPRSRVLYTTAERFVNEYIDSLRYDKPEAFRTKFRNVDCLLIDDVQFLIAKGRSEEEFFHTFNALFDSRKQIVLTSDRAPKEMSPHEQRLISRFEWGVVADIKLPDFETRVAILRKKAEDEGFPIPDEILEFIGRSMKTNIRELEGALLRTKAYSSSIQAPLTIDMVKEILHDVLSLESDQAPVRVETIQKIVAEKYRLDVRDLKGRQRTEAIAFPRQLAMYLACKLTNMSTTDIGEAFGGKDHTTVIHARNKITHKVDTDPFFMEMVNKLTGEIKAVDNP